LALIKILVISGLTGASTAGLKAAIMVGPIRPFICRRACSKA